MEKNTGKEQHRNKNSQDKKYSIKMVGLHPPISTTTSNVNGLNTLFKWQR